MTIVEALVAALIVVLMALGVMGLVSTGARNSYRAQQSQVLNDKLQAEIERIKQLPYQQIALTGAPTSSADSTLPTSRVSGTSFALNKDGSNQQPLVYNGSASHDQGETTVSGGTVDPGPTPWSSGDVSGQVYRFVTWQQDTACTRCGNPWVKHLTVAITLDTTASGGTRVYQEFQSDVSNPDANVTTGGPPGGGTNASPWTFWITDTPCNFSTRQPIVAHHASHNTRGTCSAGLKSGNNPGAPDLMFTQSTPIDNNYPPDSQPLYRYSNELLPTPDNGGNDGLQLRNGPSCSGVVSNALGVAFGTLPLIADILDPQHYQKVHKWLAPPIPTGYDILFNGTGALNLWTRSVNGAVQPGKVCVYLFYRQVSINILGIQVVTDVPAVNLDLSNFAYFSYSKNPWPTNWTEISIPLHFDLGAHLLPGTQLGVALSVDGSSGQTGSTGLEFLYDQPSFDSRLQVQTTSLLPF